MRNDWQVMFKTESLTKQSGMGEIQRREIDLLLPHDFDCDFSSGIVLHHDLVLLVLLKIDRLEHTKTTLKTIIFYALTQFLEAVVSQYDYDCTLELGRRLEELSN